MPPPSTTTIASDNESRIALENRSPVKSERFRIRTTMSGGLPALGIPAEMLACHTHAGLLAIVLEHRIEMRAYRRVLLGKRRIAQPFAGTQIVDRLVEEPRSAIGAAADHYAVGPRLLERGIDVLECVDVAGVDHRQPGRGPDLADEGPIGMAIIELAARAAMHSEHLDAALLGDARQD